MHRQQSEYRRQGFKHQKKGQPSFQSRLIERGMAFFKPHYTAHEEKIHLDELKKQVVYQLPFFLQDKYHIIERNYADIPVYLLRNQKLKEKKHILYLHGGAYIKAPTPFHWRFLYQLIEGKPLSVTVPIYPKAPCYTYVNTYAKVVLLYRQMLKTVGAENIVIMGDSAGGGLALGFCQYLKEKGLPQPQHIILISPWVDLTLSNPEIKDYESLDPMLSVEALKIDALSYAGGTDLKHYMLSPLYGNLENLAPLTIFVGTHEIFLPDIRRLKKALETLKIPFNYFEYPHMNHIFTTYPIPEAKHAILQILDIIDVKN